MKGFVTDEKVGCNTQGRQESPCKGKKSAKKKKRKGKKSKEKKEITVKRKERRQKEKEQSRTRSNETSTHLMRLLHSHLKNYDFCRIYRGSR